MKKIILLLFSLVALVGVQAQSLSTAKSNWTVIKNETAKGANTATRVGSAGISIVDATRDTLGNFYDKATTRSVISDSCDAVRLGVSSSLSNYYTKPQTSAVIHDSTVTTKTYVSNNFVSKVGASTVTSNTSGATLIINNTGTGASLQANNGIASINSKIVSYELPAAPNTAGFSTNGLYTTTNSSFVVTDTMGTKAEIRSSVANLVTKNTTQTITRGKIISTTTEPCLDLRTGTSENIALIATTNSSMPAVVIGNSYPSGIAAQISGNVDVTGLITLNSGTDTSATMSYARSLKPTYSSLIPYGRQYNHVLLGNTLEAGFTAPFFDTYGCYNLIATFNTGIYQLVNGDTILYVLQSYSQNLGKITQTAVSKYATYFRQYDENTDTFSAWKSNLFGYDDLNFAVASGKTGGANMPTWSTFTTNTGAYTFAVNDYIDLGTVELPHSAIEGDTVEFHVHWANQGIDASDRAVKYQLFITYAYPDGGSHQFSTETSLSAETNIPANTPDKSAFYTSLGVIVDSNMKIGTQIKTRLKRITSTGTAPSGNPFVGQVGIHYKVNSIGSRKRSLK